MFERFSHEARQAVELAREEARHLGHVCIGTEHLLIGMLEVGGGAAAEALVARGLTVPALRERVVAALGEGLDRDALAAIGIDLDAVRAATEATFGPGALERRSRCRPRTGHLPMSKRAKKVLGLALREAVCLHSDSIGSGHLLLGLLREGQGLGARLLADAHIDADALRSDVTGSLTRRAA